MQDHNIYEDLQGRGGGGRERGYMVYSTSSCQNTHKAILII